MYELYNLGYKIIPAKSEAEAAGYKSMLPADSFVVLINGGILQLPGGLPLITIDGYFARLLNDASIAHNA